MRRPKNSEKVFKKAGPRQERKAAVRNGEHNGEEGETLAKSRPTKEEQPTPSKHDKADDGVMSRKTKDKGGTGLKLHGDFGKKSPGTSEGEEMEDVDHPKLPEEEDGEGETDKETGKKAGEEGEKSSTKTNDLRI